MKLVVGECRRLADCAWLPLFLGPTMLIAHRVHGKWFHLGFETNMPKYGNWKPELVNAQMELWKSNRIMQSNCFTMLIPILSSTRAQSKAWLKRLVNLDW